MRRTWEWITDKADKILFAIVVVHAMVIISTFGRFKFFQRFMEEQRRKIRSQHFRDMANRRWDMERAKKKKAEVAQQELPL